MLLSGWSQVRNFCNTETSVTCLGISVSVSRSVVPDSLRPMYCSPPGSSVHEVFQQGYWSGLPFPSPGDLPYPGIEPGSPALQADSLLTELQGKPCFGISGCINKLLKIQHTDVSHLFLWMIISWSHNLFIILFCCLRLSGNYFEGQSGAEGRLWFQSQRSLSQNPRYIFSNQVAWNKLSKRRLLFFAPCLHWWS